MNTNQDKGASISTKGTIELSGSVDSHLSGTTKTELLVDQRPIVLQVSTTTDWPFVIATGMVGAGSIITALAVAWISRANQKSQSAAVMAGFRRDWQLELRNACSTLFGIITRLKYEIRKEEMVKKDKVDLLQKFAETKARIEFLLDPEKLKNSESKEGKNLSNLKTSLSQLAKEIPNAETAGYESARNLFIDSAHAVLEDAWTDIKNDAYGADEVSWLQRWTKNNKEATK